MKVLIVDDERHVVDAIVLLVPWEELGISAILTAFSVEEAKNILHREAPELVIVDVVIGDMLGTEILTCINELKLPAKVIVISGYDDYQYIRGMFVLGAIDYLLKPIEQEPLIEAVRTAAGQLEESPSKPEGTPLSAYQRNLYRSLLLATGHDEIYLQICRENKKMEEASLCQVLYSDGFMLPIYSEGYLLELNKLLDVICQKLEGDGCGTLFSINTSIIDIVIFLYGDFSMAVDFIARKVRSFNLDKRIPLCFGSSLPQPLPGGEALGLGQARMGAELAGVKERREIIFFDQSSPKMELHTEPDEENRLFSALLTGEDPGGALDSWLCAVLKNKQENRGMIKRTWEYFQFLYEKWNRYFLNQYPDYETVPFPGIKQLQASAKMGVGGKAMLQEIFGDSLKTMYAHKRQVQNSRSRMREVADYLELNYNKKIQQAECAAIFHLNKDYMSRKFKEEMGVGVVEYINQIRINKAKELLCNTDQTIQEVSDHIGFADQKYFSRQFKKETSLSPTEYRTRNKNNHSDRSAHLPR